MQTTPVFCWSCHCRLVGIIRVWHINSPDWQPVWKRIGEDGSFSSAEFQNNYLIILVNTYFMSIRFECFDVCTFQKTENVTLHRMGPKRKTHTRRQVKNKQWALITAEIQIQKVLHTKTNHERWTKLKTRKAKYQIKRQRYKPVVTQGIKTRKTRQGHETRRHRNRAEQDRRLTRQTHRQQETHRRYTRAEQLIGHRWTQKKGRKPRKGRKCKVKQDIWGQNFKIKEESKQTHVFLQEVICWEMEFVTYFEKQADRLYRCNVRNCSLF